MTPLKYLFVALVWMPCLIGIAHGADPEDMPMTQLPPILERGNRVPDGVEIAPPAPGMADMTAGAETDDLLCENAPVGTVAEVPAPFNQWLVLVCSPIGQALVPIKGTSWVAHGTLDPISILAQPPTASAIPPSEAFDPRYGIRFKMLVGLEASDERRQRAMAMLKLASGDDSMPAIDDIWQLDAVSNIVDTRYNIFFYTQNDKPQRIIACLDQCQQALLLDVVPSANALETTSGINH